MARKHKRKQHEGSETVVVTAERATHDAGSIARFSPESSHHDWAWKTLVSMADLKSLSYESMSESQRDMVQFALSQYGYFQSDAFAKGKNGQAARVTDAAKFNAEIEGFFKQNEAARSMSMDDKITYMVSGKLTAEKILTTDEIHAALNRPNVYTAEHQKMYPNKILERWQNYVNEHYDGNDVALANPNAGKTEITSGFGKRKKPMPGASAYHQAFDLANTENDYVVAAAPGIVLTSGRSDTMARELAAENGTGEGTKFQTPGGLGNYADVGHADGRTVTRYSEMANLKDMPKAGQVVVTGNPMGIEGKTGVSTGKHTHFEVIKDGKKVKPVLNGRTDLAKGDTLPATPLVPLKDRKGREVPVGPTVPDAPDASVEHIADAKPTPDYQPTYKNVIAHAAGLKDVSYASLDAYQVKVAVAALKTYPSYAESLKGFDAASEADKAKMFNRTVSQYLIANGFDNGNTKDNGSFTAQQQLQGIIAFDLAKRPEAKTLLAETHIDLAKFDKTKAREDARMKQAEVTGASSVEVARMQADAVLSKASYTADGQTVGTGKSRLLVKRIGESVLKPGATKKADGDYIQLTYITADGKVFNFTGVTGGGGKGSMPSLGEALTSERGLTFRTNGMNEFAYTNDYGSFFIPLINPSKAEMDAYNAAGRDRFGIHGGGEEGSSGCLKITDPQQQREFQAVVKKYGVPEKVEIVSNDLMAAIVQSAGQVQLASADMPAASNVSGGGRRYTRSAPNK